MPDLETSKTHSATAKELAAELRRFDSDICGFTVSPLSEIADRFTILSIKRKAIQDRLGHRHSVLLDDRLKGINIQLESCKKALKLARATLREDDKNVLTGLVKELKVVNQLLWGLEDRYTVLYNLHGINSSDISVASAPEYLKLMMDIKGHNLRRSHLKKCVDMLFGNNSVGELKLF